MRRSMRVRRRLHFGFARCSTDLMRITNDDYSPIDLLAEIATRRGTTSGDTHRFFRDHKTSHDWLVDEWFRRVDCILESFKRYGVDVNVTQFVRDQGIDLLFRISDHHGEPRRLGLQVKSEREAQAERNRKPGQETMIGTLKRQAHDARERVDEWWVLCCFDSTKHQNLVQAISSELTGGKQNGWIRVIEPRACAAVLGMSEAEVDAFCTLLLCREDEVLQAARAEVSRHHVHAMNFVFAHLIPGLVDGEPVSREAVANFLEEAIQASESERGGCDGDWNADKADEAAGGPLEVGLDNHGQDDIEYEEGHESVDVFEILEELERSGFISAGTYDDDYRIVPTAFPGLCALFFEARVRHGMSDEAAAEYMRYLALV